MSAEWNSLEIAKLVASCATPIAVAGFGIYIHRVTKRFEHSQWRNQKVIEKRLAIYDSLAPDLNTLLCYFTYVGCWKDFEPTKIIEMKRKVDREIYLAQPLFSPDFFNACTDFISTCFETFTGWGQDAKLRSHFERRREATPKWNAAWEKCFSDKPSEVEEVRRAYQRIMKIFASEIGVPGFKDTRCGRLPANIR